MGSVQPGGGERLLRQLRRRDRPGPLRDRQPRRAASSARTWRRTTSTCAAYAQKPPRAGAARGGARLERPRWISRRWRFASSTTRRQPGQAHRVRVGRGRAPRRRGALRERRGPAGPRRSRSRRACAAISSTTTNEGGYFGDRGTDNGAVSGFAAATLGSCGGFSATAQVARGFRDPMLSDRYYRGPTGRGFITGNPDLDPETSLQLDLAAALLAARASGPRSTRYQYRIDDLIERYQTEADFFFFRNRGEARIRASRPRSRPDCPWQLSLQATAHLLEGEVLDDGTSLDGIPPATVTLRLRRELGRAWAWVRLAGYGQPGRPRPHRAGASRLRPARRGRGRPPRVARRAERARAQPARRGVPREPRQPRRARAGITGILSLAVRF